MLISLNWISEFIKINKPAREIADKITLSLSEVEKILKVEDDWVLEIENKALTHRPDCFSQIGLAREIAAYFNLSFNDPLKNFKRTTLKVNTLSLPFRVKVINPDLATRYQAVVLKNIKVDQSPEFIQKRLKSCNVRPINNVVDITNYVMLELGQPIHAFSYDKLIGHEIIVRNAYKNETLVTLDGIKRKLSNNMLVIADSKKPVALAGIMGGKESEVTKNTTKIVIESANFDASTTRKTAKNLGLRTEAVTRFEKSLDPLLTDIAVYKAVSLLEKYAGAQVASKVFDLYSNKQPQKQITTTVIYINSLLGLNLSADKIILLLKRLCLSSKISKDNLVVQIPSYRRDLHIEADIAEEVARIYGYDNIPTTLPKGIIKPPVQNISLELEKKVKLFLSSIGFNESPLPSFIGEKTDLKLLNPISPEKTYLRKSLLPGLIFAAKSNLRFFNNFNLFEIGRVFNPTRPGKLPIEQKYLAGVLVGKTYFEVKGVIEALFEYLSVDLPSISKIDKGSIYSNSASAKISDFGRFGEVNNDILDFLNTKKSVSVFELNFDLLVKLSTVAKFYKPIPIHPPIIEDFTFVFGNDIKIGSVLHFIKNIDHRIDSVDITNKYESSYTFRISFNDPKKALTKEDIAPIRKKLASGLKQKFNTKIKGGLG